MFFDLQVGLYFFFNSSNKIDLRSAVYIFVVAFATNSYVSQRVSVMGQFCIQQFYRVFNASMPYVKLFRRNRRETLARELTDFDVSRNRQLNFQ